MYYRDQLPLYRDQKDNADGANRHSAHSAMAPHSRRPARAACGCAAGPADREFE